ncbi:GMC oxidoreductase [Actinomadura parmotrematis]|uniref:Cholesterol oxidase n=1 Tax=Actinomadura parmotrematis TaxID=2864039 RepID=A0ABS7G1B7_9ACTN|nr:GMC family oxidoreductase [Actinomadura parmotrematis]MBW8485637.1 GMC family oxidoreductase [Actinomadura parmotrematis]
MEHVDAVVIGSGFGGSVAAFRLAEAGKSVVLLERGQPYPPGSFPRTPAQMGRAFWDPDEKLYGMFDVWRFQGCDSIVSSGLGGGSLIYANVLLRKDEHWFVQEQEMPGGGFECWPVGRADLDPHYDAVERMLGATPYPFDQAPFDNTPKTHAMQDAAAELGLDWKLPNLAVSFAPRPGAAPAVGLPIVETRHPSLHGVERRTCAMCGQCDIGCNDGSKNSLDHTYLSAAAAYGADLRTLHEVKAIRPRPGGGYEVDYVHHATAEDAPPPARRTISCDRLVLGAGTYGTTFLLLRSAAAFPGLSKALGTRFCGNGDLLTFLLKATDSGGVRPLDAGRGPVITSTIRLPDELDGAPGGPPGTRGAYIQDGGYPAFAEWPVQMLDVRDTVTNLARFMLDRARDFFTLAPDTNLSAELAELIGDGSFTLSSLPLLGMGRDTADGRLELRRGRLQAAWTPETSRAHFERLRATMKRMADVLGAQYADNPIWFRKRVVTVHPLGGAPMADRAERGVCDAYGEVFGYPGLYIADGSVMPGPVGANPSLTIAAFADRQADRLLEAAAKGPPPAPAPAPGARPTSLAFTERMSGSLTPGATDPRAGARGAGAEDVAFELTITADDIDRFLDDPGHTATAEGWIEAAAFGGRRMVEQGWFNLFVPDGGDDRRAMRYRLFFTGADGRPRTLAGEKDVRHGPPTRIWPDTSTLHARVLDGHVTAGQEAAGATVTGAGALHIQLNDFARQLTTFRTTGPRGARAIIRFGRFFAGELWEVYGPDLE